MASQPPNPTTLDLHGRRLEDAIYEVTVFLERIRRTVFASTRGRSVGPKKILFVTIITGAGSHSSCGPVLRVAVEKLLQKRGMNFRLERGGGAFKVDALSGWDLYGPGPATESKVVLAETDEFHQLALARKRPNNAGSFASVAECTSVVSRPCRRTTAPISSPRSKSDPLPSQVASEDAAIRAATKLSTSESQQQRNRQHHMEKEYERQIQQAISATQREYAAPRTSAEKMNEEDYETALKQSAEDHQHKQLTEQEYAEALMLAMEQSTVEARESKGPDYADDENEQLRIALEKSIQEIKTTETSEDDLLERALAESRALAKAEAAKKDECLEKALTESLLEEERQKARAFNLHTPSALLDEAKFNFSEGVRNTSEDEILEKALAESLLEDKIQTVSVPYLLTPSDLLRGAPSKTCQEEQILQRTISLSLNQSEDKTLAVEDVMQTAIEMSKHTMR